MATRALEPIAGGGRLGCAKTAIEIAAGETYGKETLPITAEPAALENRLGELLHPEPGEVERPRR